ncbi:MAG: hypothetical protein B7Z07_02190 [Sphingomonadales bacterium 32-67-7]|nr:MAG: hypothetical protein B7Z07_02190 [Sphingomonadales bacterium 32-67-7]
MGGDQNRGLISAAAVGTTTALPIESRRRREQGEVVLNVLLDTDGRVQEISVARSSGSDRLDKAALAAVSRWRWSPMIEAGAPAMVCGVVTLPFALQS